MPKKTQTFNDGAANIYSVENISEAGNMPKDGLVIKHENVRYGERIVGMSRFWTAMQENTKIEQLLRFPRINTVKRDDVVIPNDGNQYKIKQVQYIPKEDVLPLCMDLSLERVDADYVIAGS